MRRVLFGLLTGALLVGGCGSSGGGGFSERQASGKPGVFRYPLVTAPTSLDPAKVQDGDTIDVVQQVFEGLVQWGPDNTVQPNLAEKWEIKDGGTNYVFTLKKGVKFTSGREVKAQDFKWCIERACNPKFSSPTAETYLGDIVGLKDRLKGKATEISGIKVVSDYVLEIHIDKARPYELGKFTYPIMFVFDKDALKDPLADITTVEQMVGTGAFKFETIKNDQQITLVANKDYHDGAPKLERIERPVVLDAQTRLNMYKTGQIDLVQLERQDVKAIEADATLKDSLKFFDRPSVFYVAFNSGVVPAFKNQKLRRALAMGLDRDQIVTKVLGGMVKKATGVLPPGVFGARETANVVPFNLEEAKKLLAEAGYPGGKGFPDVEMSFRDGRPDVELVATAIQNQWQENLGVKISLQKREWGAYLKKNNAKELPLFHMRWAADYLDAENFLSTLLASYGNENKIYYSNPQFDALCREADTTLDEAKRKDLYAKAEDMVLQDAPFVPIYFQRDAELIRKNVTGLRESLFGHLPHRTVSVQ